MDSVLYSINVKTRSVHDPDIQEYIEFVESRVRQSLVPFTIGQEVTPALEAQICDYLRSFGAKLTTSEYDRLSGVMNVTLEVPVIRPLTTIDFKIGGYHGDFSI
jgi:hypothetical protein